MQREPIRPDYKIVVAPRVVVVVFIMSLVFDVRQVAIRTAIVVAAVCTLKPNKVGGILALAKIALICLIAKLVLSCAGLFRLH